MRLLRQLLTSDLGQDLVEYVLALALIVLITTALMVTAGESLRAVWNAPVLTSPEPAASTDHNHH